MKNYRRAKGFTLAEVLITLGIIGVVAAITIPNLVAKYQEKVWITKFQQTYAILTQAYIQAVNENGLPETWNLTPNNHDSSVKVYNYLAKNLKNTEHFPQITSAAQARKLGITIDIKGLNGSENQIHGSLVNEDIFKLANGALVYISCGDNSHDGVVDTLIIKLDTNGINPPNTFGKDFFFLILNKKKNAPVITSYSLSRPYCSLTNSAGAWYSGGSCSYWLLKRGNMDYLHRELTVEEWQH